MNVGRLNEYSKTILYSKGCNVGVQTNIFEKPRNTLEL